MFRSIRFRLTVWYTVVVALTFLVASWAIYEYVKRTLWEALDQAVTNEIKWVAARYEKRIQRMEPAEVTREDIFEHASFFPTKEYVEIWDSTGRIFYKSPNLADDTLASHLRLAPDQSWILTTVSTFRNHDIRLAVYRIPSATVYLAMPTEGTTAPIDQLVRIIGLLVPFVVLVAIAGGVYLARKSFAKINQVIEIAQRITADRLNDRIPEHDTRDEIGRIISTLNEMISRLDISFQQMRQFSADASHELRTPLSVMRSQLETLLSGDISVEEMKKIAADCLDEAIRMSTIIENLLLLTKGDAGQDFILREPVDLRKLIRQTYDESVILAAEKSITVRLRQEEDAIIVGDEHRLRQLLLNLIDNAIKYNRTRGRIDLSLTKENGSARISIADTGIGIPEEEISRIFDRFYRVDRARSREPGGAGLGLSIAQWIIQAHRGTISVDSRVDQGSTFTIHIPLVPV